jgi:hypothetical protein
MTDTDHSLDDPLADALLSGSTYDRLRVQRFSYFKQTIPQKLVVQSGLLFTLAFVLPLAAGFPAETKALFAGHAPVVASPKALLLGLVAAAIELGTAATLIVVTVARLRIGPEMTVETARRLLNVEDVATLLGFVTGGAAVLLTVGFFLLGYAGPDALASFVTAGGTSPYTPSGAGVSVATLGLGALAGGLLVLGSSVGLNGLLD